MEPNSSQKRAHDDAFSQLALPPNPSKSSALEPDQQQPEITPLDCLPKPLATKQYIERSLESSANSRQTFRLASFVPPAAQSHQRRRLDSTVYHSTIPFDAKRSRELHSEIIKDQAFLQNMYSQWEDKLEQIKEAQALLKKMSEVKEVDVKDIEPLFKDHFSPLFTAQESENGPPRPIFPMASSRDPSSGSGTQPDGLDYGPNVNPKAWSPKLPLTPPKTTIDISNTPPNEQTLPETEKVQVSQDDSDMEDEYLSSDDEVYSDEDGLEAINAADEDDEAARLALTSMLVEFGGI